MATVQDLRGYIYQDADVKMSHFFNAYSGYSETEKINLIYTPIWVYNTLNKTQNGIQIYSNGWIQVDPQIMVKSDLLIGKSKRDFICSFDIEGDAKFEHKKRTDLAFRRMLKLNKLSGRRESSEAASKIRHAFVTNFSPSKWVFQTLQHTEFLQNAYFWTDLTINGFLNLNDNLQLLCESTQQANKMRRTDPKEYEKQLEIRQSALAALGIDDY